MPLRCGTEGIQRRECDPLEPEISPTQVERAPEFGTGEGMREEKVREAIAIDVAHGDRSSHRQEPLGDMAKSRVHEIVGGGVHRHAKAALVRRDLPQHEAHVPQRDLWVEHRSVHRPTKHRQPSEDSDGPQELG